MRRPSHMPAAYAVVLGVVPLTAVAFLEGAMDGSQIPKWWLVVVLAGIGVASGAFDAAKSPRLLVPSPWFVGAVLSLGVAVVVSVALADERMRAVMGTYSRWNGAAAYLAFLTFALLAAISLNTPGRRRRLGSIILATSGVVAGYALLQKAGVDPLPWDVVYQGASSFLGNPNFASGYMGIPVPLLAARLVETGSPRLKAGYAALLVLLLGGQWATGSWLGPLAMLAGLAAMVVVLLASSDRPVRRRSGGALAVVGPLAALGGVYGLWSGVLPSPENVEIRFYYWKAAIGMLGDFPLFGVGFGRFGDFLRRYRPIADYPQYAETAFGDNPHSVILALASEGGLLVLTPWLVLLGVITGLVVAWVRSTRNEETSKPDRLVVAAWAGTFSGYLGQAVASFDVTPLGVLGFVLGGCLMTQVGSTAEITVPGTPLVRRSAAAIAGVAAVTLIVLASVPLEADLAAGEGRRQALAGNFGSALELFDEAAERAWWEPRYMFGAGQVAYEAGVLPTALDRFERSAMSFEEIFQPALRSARTSVELGQLERAAEWYRRALILEPNDEELAVEAGEIIDLADDSS